MDDHLHLFFRLNTQLSHQQKAVKELLSNYEFPVRILQRKCWRKGKLQGSFVSAAVLMWKLVKIFHSREFCNLPPWCNLNIERVFIGKPTVSRISTNNMHKPNTSLRRTGIFIEPLLHFWSSFYLGFLKTMKCKLQFLRIECGFELVLICCPSKKKNQCIAFKQVRNATEERILQPGIVRT